MVGGEARSSEFCDDSTDTQKSGVLMCPKVCDVIHMMVITLDVQRPALKRSTKSTEADIFTNAVKFILHIKTY